MKVRPLRYQMAELVDKLINDLEEDSRRVFKDRHEKENLINNLHTRSASHTGYKAITHGVAVAAFIALGVVATLLKDSNLSKSLPTALYSIANNTVEGGKALIDRQLAKINPQAQMEDQKNQMLNRRFNEIFERSVRIDQTARRAISAA